MMRTKANRALAKLSGEELLLLAMRGDPVPRHLIERELNLRALLAECTRRAHAAQVRSRLRLVGLTECESAA